MFGFSIGKYVSIAAGIALLLLAAHDRRVDYLRAGYKHQLETIRIVFADLGHKPKSDADIAVQAYMMGHERDRYRRERDNAQQVVDIQSRSITAMAEETKQASERSAANLRLIAEVQRQRDSWIQRARQAATRTQKQTAEQELKECDSTLNALYSSGF